MTPIDCKPLCSFQNSPTNNNKSTEIIRRRKKASSKSNSNSGAGIVDENDLSNYQSVRTESQRSCGKSSKTKKSTKDVQHVTVDLRASRQSATKVTQPQAESSQGITKRRRSRCERTNSRQSKNSNSVSLSRSRSGIEKTEHDESAATIIQSKNNQRQFGVTFSYLDHTQSGEPSPQKEEVQTDTMVEADISNKQRQNSDDIVNVESSENQSLILPESSEQSMVEEEQSEQVFATVQTEYSDQMDQPPLTERLCANNVKAENGLLSPLQEREKFLESSAQELQQKLSKVRDEIQQLSSADEQSLMHEHNSMLGGFQLQTGASPDQYDSSLNMQQTFSQISYVPERVGTQDTEPRSSNIQEDQARVQKQKMFEYELERLRQQLASFNEEERRVIQELEETRSLRRAFGTNGGGTSGPDCSYESNVESSFQLQPQRLNFDGCSQKSNQFLSSPILNPSAASGFKATQPVSINMTNEESSQYMTTQPDAQSESDGICDVQGPFASNGANGQAATSGKFPDDSIDRRLVDGTNKPAETITIVEQGQDEPEPLSPNQLNDYQLQQIELMKAADTFALKSKQIAALQFSQIIEEEHESESNITSSVNHSRKASSILMQNATATNSRAHHSHASDHQAITTDQRSSLRASIDHSQLPLGEQFVTEIALFNEVSDDSLKQLCEEDSSLQNDTVKDVIVSLNLKSLQRTGKLGSNQLSQSGLVPVGQYIDYRSQNYNNGSNSENSNEAEQEDQEEMEFAGNTLRKFERLIQETQRSDESSLLRHIQRNIEQLQSAGDQQSRFAQLQQQQSPSPVKAQMQQFKFPQASTQLAKKIAEGNCNDSVDTCKLIADYNLLQEMSAKQARQMIKAESTNHGQQTLMSDTTQFLAGDGQAATKILMVSNRSSIEQPSDESGQQTIRQTNNKSCFLPSQKKKSRNALPSEQSQNNNNQISCSKQSLTSMHALGEPPIQILHNPAAPTETMTSGAAQNPLSFENSLDDLSKASPFFQQHTSFEQTKHFNAKTINNMVTIESNETGPVLSEKIESISFCQNNRRGQRGVFPMSYGTNMSNSGAITGSLPSERMECLTFEKVEQQPQHNSSEIMINLTSPTADPSRRSMEFVRNFFNQNGKMQKDESDQTGPQLQPRTIMASHSTQNLVNLASNPPSNLNSLRAPCTAPSPDARSLLQLEVSTATYATGMLNNATENEHRSMKKIVNAQQSLTKRDQKDQKAQPFSILQKSASHSQLTSMANTPINKTAQSVKQLEDSSSTNRSSFNIYKRNSVKMTQRTVGDADIPASKAIDTNLLTKLPYQSTIATQIAKKKIQHHPGKSIDDTHLLQVPSQTTINLDQLSPFLVEEKSPGLGMAKVYARTHEKKEVQEQETPKYDDCYENFTKGSVTPSDVARSKWRQMAPVVLQPMAGFGRRDSDFGAQSKSQMNTERPLIKNKSASMLGTNTYSSNSLSNYHQQIKQQQQQSRVSPCVINLTPAVMKREQDAQIAFTSQSMLNLAQAGDGICLKDQITELRKSRSLYNNSHQTTANQRSRHATNTPSPNVAYSTIGGRKASFPGNQTSRSKQKITRADIVADAAIQANSVVYTEGQQQQQVTTPSYMQPIQSKFKKQTIQMVRGKQSTKYVIPSMTNSSNKSLHQQVMGNFQRHRVGVVPFKSASVNKLL